MAMNPNNYLAWELQLKKLELQSMAANKLEERIEKLEGLKELIIDLHRDWLESSFGFEERIKELEEYHERAHLEREAIYSEIDKAKVKIGYLHSNINGLEESHKKPHKCPVCEGSSFCSAGMECVPCQGSGIVWG